MESHRLKSLSADSRSRKRFRFATNKQKSQRASADVYRRYKRRIGVNSAATREEDVHHASISKKPPKRQRVENDSSFPAEADHNHFRMDEVDIVLDETTFSTELELALERNPSDIFGTFYREVWPLVRSLPEMMHHAERIVEIMLRFMLSPEEAPNQKSTDKHLFDENNSSQSIRYQVNLATTDIFHLLAVLARDLRHEIHPWLHKRILPRIVHDLLNPPPPKSGKQPIPLDVTFVEAAFRAVAYLLRYDSEALLSETASTSKKEAEQPCLELMRQYYGPTLANKRELVRRLAAETFAPLIRKLKSDSAKKRHLRRVLRALDSSAATTQQQAAAAAERLEEDAVDGIAQLCFELAKGVAGDFHSKGSFVMECVLSSVVGGVCGNTEHSTTIKKKLSEEVAIKLFKRLMTVLKPENAARLVTDVKDQLVALKKLGDIEKHNSDSYNSLARLSCEIVSHNHGVMVSGSEEKDTVLYIIQEISDMLLGGALGNEVEESLAKLLCASWLAFPGDVEVSKFLKTTVGALLGIGANDEVVRTAASPMFRGLVAICIFYRLPLELAMRDVGFLLLKAASKTTTRDECLALVHGVVCFRGGQIDSVVCGDNDDIFFPEKARLCNLEPKLISTLLDRMIVPFENEKNTSQTLLASIRCAAFVAVSNTNADVFGRSYERTANWLADMIIHITYKTVLLVSTSIEALARISSIALDHSVEPEAIESPLIRIRSSCETVLLNNPSSPSLLKACALYCKILGRVSKYLCDDFNPVFEALTPNLNCPSHFMRKHSLEIMTTFPKKPFVHDHADLDLMDDLDEEPSFAGPGNIRKGPAGVCDIIDTLLQAELLPLELASERPMVAFLSRVEILGRTGKLPISYADAAASHLLGLLHVKFSQVWKPAIKALAVVARTYEQSTWSIIFGMLSRLMKTGHSDSENSSLAGQEIRQPSGFDLGVHFSAVDHWESSAGTRFELFSDVVHSTNEAGKISMFESRVPRDVLHSLWELFEAEPALIISNSRDMVPLVLGFMAGYGMEEVRMHAHVDNDALESRPMATLGRRDQEQRLLSILKAFAALKGPEQLACHRKIYRIFVAILEHHDVEVVRIALECVLRFKPTFLMPHANRTRELLVKGKMRDAMISLKEEAANGKILSSHREKLTPLLARIVIGRLSAKSGFTKSVKDTPAARRTAVFSFASGFCATECDLFPFLWLAVRRYLPASASEKAVEDFTESDRANILHALSGLTSKDLEHHPVNLHEGVLNCLGAIIEQLGYRVLNFVPCFLAITLGLLEVFSLQEKTTVAALEEAEGDETDLVADRSGRVRSLCQLRLAEILNKFGGSFDFSLSGERMWKCLDRSLSLLPQLVKSANKPPSLLQLLLVISRNDRLRYLLNLKDEAIGSVFSCLSQSDSGSIVDTVLSFIENVLEMLKNEKETSAKDQACYLKHVPTLLEHFESRLKDFGTTLSWKRELCILSKVSKLPKNEETGLGKKELDSLALLLVPFLSFESRSADKDRLHILDVLNSILPNVSTESAVSLFSPVSVLLGPWKSGPGLSNLTLRQGLGKTLALIGRHMKNVEKISIVIESLCSVNPKMIDEINADKVLTALKDLRTPESQGSWSSLLKCSKHRRNITPVIRICFHFLFNEDGVVARGSFYALKDLIERMVEIDQDISENMEEAEQLTWEKFLEQSVAPLIRSGVASKDETARRYFILLAGDLSKVCSSSRSPHLLGDLSILLSEQVPDLDFFQNITHVQIHRRSRALSRLRKNFLAENSDPTPFSPQSLTGILLPIILHPIYESKTKLDEPLALEAIATLGALGRKLPWKKFQDELWTLLIQVDRQPQQEKFIIGGICSLMSGFHFDIGNPYDNDDHGEGKGNAAWNALERRIIPKLETFFTKEKTRKSGERIALVRPQVILGLVELYQKLPGGMLQRKLPRLLTVLSDALKSKDSDAREIAGNTLAKLAAEVGVEFLPDILRELAVTLKEGYQLHVRAATVHSILLILWEKFFSRLEDPNGHRSHAIDASVPALMDLVQQDLFGSAQERKDAEFSQVRYVKEAGGSKSLHSIELIAGMITLNTTENTREQQAVYGLISPFLNRMGLEDQNAKQLRHLRECLNKVVQGLSMNKTFSSSGVLPLIYATIHRCITSDVADSEPSETERISEVVKWLPSSAGMAATAVCAMEDKRRSEREQGKVIDGSEAPKLTGSWRRSVVNRSKKSLDDPSSVAAVLFGLQLLRYALRKGVENAYEQLGPFVPLLTECICSCRDSEAVLLAMRCLGDVKGMVPSLESFDSSFRALAPKTLELLVGYGGNEELLQASFKTMTYLIEGCSKRNVLVSKSKDNEETNSSVLNEEQMEVLLSFLQTSLTNAAQHNPAMTLIKILVAKEVISPGMYDLMGVVLKQSIQSHKETLRQQCSQVYVRFLMNYPMSTERMEKELKQLVLNIQYDEAEGRQNAIAMVNSVLKKFPEPVVVKHCQLFFVPLILQVGNDDSEKCRRSTAKCISTLITRVPSEVQQPLLDYALKWGASSDSRLRRVAFSVLGIFAESSDIMIKVESNLNAVVLLLAKALDMKEDWELVYFALLLLEKTSKKGAKKVVATLEVWPKVVACLDLHPWVSLVTLRILQVHLQSLNPKTFLEDDTISFLKEPGRIFDLLQALTSVLGGGGDRDQNEETTSLVIQALLWCLKASNQYPGLCFKERTVESENRDPVRWLLTRLSNIAKPRSSRQRQAVFKCFAAFAQYGDGIAFDHLELLIEPLYRVERETRNEMENDLYAAGTVGKTPASEESWLVKDVLHLLEQHCTPHDKFVDAYSAVKKRAQEKKTKRLKEAKTEAARNPKIAAQQKDKKHMREKKRRKRSEEGQYDSRGVNAKWRR